MVRLDTLKILVPNHYVKHVDFGGMTKVFDVYRYVFKDVLGMKMVQVSDEGVILEGSSKLLGGEYKEGLNKENIHEFFEAFKSFVEVDEKAYSESIVLMCDPFNDLRVSKNVDDYVLALRLSMIDSNYVVDFRTRGGYSLSFKRKVKTYNEYIRVYNKYKELVRNRKEALKLGYENFKGVLRVEQRLSSFKRIREIFCVEDNKLGLVLNSDEKVNLKALKRVLVGGRFNIEAMERIDKKELRKMIFLLGLNEFRRLHKLEYEELKEMLKLVYSKRHLYRLLKEFRGFWGFRLKGRDVSEYVNEVFELLAA